MFVVCLLKNDECRDLMTTSSEKQAEKFCYELNAKFERKYGSDNEDTPFAYISRIDDYASLGEERIPYTVEFKDDGTADAEVAELGLCWFLTLSLGGSYNSTHRAYVMARDAEHAIELAKKLREEYIKKSKIIERA